MSGLVQLDIWHDPSMLHVARPIANMIRAAGAEPHLRAGLDPPRDTDGIIVLLGPAPTSPCWIDAAWLDAIFAPAVKAKIPILPIRVADCPLPDALSHLSYADFVNRNRAAEEHRVLISLSDIFGTDTINRPKLASDIPTSPPRNAICLRYGADLAARIDDHFIHTALPMMQDGLFHELGVPFPDVHVTQDASLPPMSFAVDLFDVEEIAESIPAKKVFVNAHPDELTHAGYVCQPASNPANGHLYAWVHESHADDLMAKGFTTWDASGWMVLCLSARLRYRASTFLDQTTVAAMLNTLRPHFPRLIETTVPGALSLVDLTDILRRLVLEAIPIRNLRRILIEIAEIAAYENHPDVMTEYVRAAMKDVITHMASRGQGHVVVILIEEVLESRLRAATAWGKTSSWIALEPQEVAPILDGLDDLMSHFGLGVQPPVILTQLELRAAIRRLIAPRFPTIQAISYAELEPKINIQPIGRINADGITRRADVSVARTKF